MAIAKYTSEELNKIKEIELNTLKIFIEICKEIEVEYFLVGGTVLGTIRHGGFIPWDDDIDIGMTRDNYNKFIINAPDYLPKGYYLQTPYDNKKNAYPYSKIRVDGTKFVEYCNRNVDMHHGIYIDIFPHDNMPDDEYVRQSLHRKIQTLIKIFVYRQNPDISQPPEHVKGHIKKVVRRLAHYLCRLIPYDFLLNRIDKMSTKSNKVETNGIGYWYGSSNINEYIHKSDMFPLIEKKFEGINVMIPRNYDRYLKLHYNNYMEYPPPEKRYGHKPYIVEIN